MEKLAKTLNEITVNDVLGSSFNKLLNLNQKRVRDDYSDEEQLLSYEEANMLYSFLKETGAIEHFGQVPDTVAGLTTVLDYLQQNFEKTKQELSHLNTDKVTLYRGMTVEKDWLNQLQQGKLKHLGIYWTDSKENAVVYDPPGRNLIGPTFVILEVEVPNEYVDWVTTLFMRMHPKYRKENEIRLFKNTPINLKNVYWEKADSNMEYPLNIPEEIKQMTLYAKNTHSHTSSILDYPKKKLPPDIWDQENDQIKLKNKIKDLIEDIVYSAVDDLDLPPEVIKGLFIYGSILTSMWNPRTDVDARIVLDKELTNKIYPDATGDDLFELIKNKIHDVLLVPTQHPFNASLYIEGEEKEFPLIKGEDFPVYDVLNETVLVPPVIYEEYDPDVRFKEERDEVDEFMEKLDADIREARNDLIDFRVIEHAIPDVSNPKKLVKKLKDKYNEIEKDIKQLVKQKDEIKEMRTDALEKGDHFSKGNVIQKLLERYLYWDLLKQVKEVYKDGLDKEDLAELEKIFNIKK